MRRWKLAGAILAFASVVGCGAIYGDPIRASYDIENRCGFDVTIYEVTRLAPEPGDDVEGVLVSPGENYWIGSLVASETIYLLVVGPDSKTSRLTFEITEDDPNVFRVLSGTDCPH